MCYVADLFGQNSRAGAASWQMLASSHITSLTFGGSISPTTEAIFEVSALKIGHLIRKQRFDLDMQSSLDTSKPRNPRPTSVRWYHQSDSK